MAVIITLTTDFGWSDGYRAVLEGVIAGINPSARSIAITHDVPAFDLLAGWYILKIHYRYFPPGTVHLAVVDPGVGGQRKLLAVSTRKYHFVAPDNGLLSFLPSRDIVSKRAITNRKYALADVSPVFHGRDILAPAAAYLSLGVDPSCLGPSVRSIKRLPGATPLRRKNSIIGRIIWIDRFGNLVTNIEAGHFSARGKVIVNGQSIGRPRKTFSDVAVGMPLAYIGSGGHLEIGVRNGSARRFFSVDNRAEVEIQVAR